MILLGNKHQLNLSTFNNVVFGNQEVAICPESDFRLEKTTNFINFLLKSKIKVYGITTGFADLRNHSIDPDQADQLSNNLIESHDAGIGDSFSPEIILGAMLARASSLSKGFSGIKSSSLNTLIQMINARIIPIIPKTGSLGASGDLCMLSRLARAMQGKEVPVWYKGKVVSASYALEKENIPIFEPSAKEGLAMINGTSFMISMLSISFLQELSILENILAMQGLFYNAVRATDAAFNECMHDVRPHTGQQLVAKILAKHFTNSTFINLDETQNDYCIRCVPQIFGPKIEIILEQYIKIERELNAVTDNPLFFRNDEISSDVHDTKKIEWNSECWAVLSGGNFHGENVTTIVDTILAANAKLAITLERQITYMLNPTRNKTLPCYLIPESNQIGLSSGYMITQYTANSLTQKICQLGHPTSIFNITSGNESEDIVSYGSNATEKLLEQLQYLEQLNSIYFTVAIQAYSIQKQNILKSGGKISSELLADQMFVEFQLYCEEMYPIKKDFNFENRYQQAQEFLSLNRLSKIMEFPICNFLQNEDLLITNTNKSLKLIKNSNYQPFV